MVGSRFCTKGNYENDSIEFIERGGLRGSFWFFTLTSSSSTDIGWDFRHCGNFFGVFPRRFDPPLKRRKSELFADFSGREILHFRMPRNGDFFLIDRVLVNGIFSAFPYQHATIVS